MTLGGCPVSLTASARPPREAGHDGDELGWLHRLGDVRLEPREQRSPAILGARQRGDSCG